MATFDFPYHRVETQYPDSTPRVQFGRSYQFSAKPAAPDQRIFVLKFTAMKYYVTAGVVEATTDPQFNMLTLEQFYQLHQLHTIFVYPHPVHGNINCKFNKPLTVPDGIPGGGGLVNAFELELIEQP